MIGHKAKKVVITGAAGTIGLALIRKCIEEGVEVLAVVREHSVRIGSPIEMPYVYCIGSGQARPLREYIETLRDAVDPSLPLGIGDKNYA